MGIPIPRSGNFADVYEFRSSSGGHWAVKCFTREVPGLRERYAAISRHLQDAKLPFTVDFTFLEQGLRVLGKWYPVLKMQWVEGLTLNEFVRQYADKPAMLQNLLQIWVRMAVRLREAGIAHADLQHGNVLLVPHATSNALAVKLVDYDGMFVPALAGGDSGEVGHPCYQHPRRMAERTYSLEVDRFPLLLVATALNCLQVGGRPLWDKYDSGDNLLFREADLHAPAKSPLFYELLKLADKQALRLVWETLDALKQRLESAPLLEEVLPELYAPPASKPAAAPATQKRATIQATTTELAVAVQPAAEAAKASSAWAFRGEDKDPSGRRRKGGSLRWVGCAAGVCVVGLVLAGGIVALGLRNEPEQPTHKGSIAQTEAEKPPPLPDELSKEKDSKEKQSDGHGSQKNVPEAPSPPEPKTPAAEATSPESAKPAVTEGFVSLFNGKDLTGWKPHPDDKAKWKVKYGILIGSGGEGHLYSERGDYENFHFRVEAAINDGGASGQYFRTQFGPNFPKGYQAQINGTRDALPTGSLIGLGSIVKVNEQLHKPDEWYTQEVIVEGDHIVIKVNDKTVVEKHDKLYKKGHFALQVFDPATVVNFRKIEVKELPAKSASPETGEVLTPIQAADKVGQMVTMQFHLQQTSSKSEGFVELFSEEARDRAGNYFFIRFPESARKKFDQLGISDVGSYFQGKLIRVTGTVSMFQFKEVSYPCIVIDDPGQILVLELPRTKPSNIGSETKDLPEKETPTESPKPVAKEESPAKPSESAPSRPQGNPLPDAKEVAAKAYDKSCAAARTRLLKAFDTVVDKVSKSKGSTEARLKMIAILKEEKQRFENRGLIPWSEPMRPSIDQYFKVLTAAQRKLGRVYESLIDLQLRTKNQSKIEDLREELKNRLDIRVMARWQYFLNGRQTGIPTLYSNGKINAIDGKATWTYDQGVLIFRWPDSRAPGGVWIDTLHVSADGTTFQGTNNARPPGPKLTGVYMKDD